MVVLDLLWRMEIWTLRDKSLRICDEIIQLLFSIKHINFSIVKGQMFIMLEAFSNVLSLKFVTYWTVIQILRQIAQYTVEIEACIRYRRCIMKCKSSCEFFFRFNLFLNFLFSRFKETPFR